MILDRFSSELHGAVGRDVILTDRQEMAGYLADWRGLVHGDACAVALPRSVDEVSRIVQLCARSGVGIVPQGGNTSMSVGATPASGSQLLVMNLGRLRTVRSLDPVDMSMIAEAGVVLATAQELARSQGCRLPLSLGSEGSATIGGVVSTNAGGTHTLRFGNMRNLVLGVEAVLADGRVVNTLRTLRKDNSGYALHQLLTGAEGTLAIITAAAIALYPEPEERQTMLCAVPNAAAALELYRSCRRAVGGSLDAFEYMSRASVGLVERHVEGVYDPTASEGDLVLVELAGSDSSEYMRGQLEQAFVTALDNGVVTDAVIAESLSQRAMLWRIREEHSEAQKRAGLSVKHDVSVPVAATATLIERAAAICGESARAAMLAPFGHIGDGNIHLNVVQVPDGADLFPAEAQHLSAALLALVRELGGSFSAEHGVGRLKRAEFDRWGDPVANSVMRSIKKALDPLGILNPGVIFEDDDHV